MRNNRCLIFAHRGASAYEKDNTFKAFELAISQGADFIELDVRHTKDGVLVVLHNKYIRKGWRHYRISTLTFEQLNSLQDQVVALEDIFERFRGRVGFDLDIKELRDYRPLVNLLEKYNLDSHQVFFNCNRSGAIQFLKKVLPNYRYVLSYCPSGSVDLRQRKIVQLVVRTLSQKAKRLLPQRFKRTAVKTGIYGVSLPETIVYQELVDYFHQHGLKVYVWPPEDEASLKRLIQFGVDGIKTSRPDLLRQLLSG